MGSIPSMIRAILKKSDGSIFAAGDMSDDWDFRDPITALQFDLFTDQHSARILVLRLEFDPPIQELPKGSDRLRQEIKRLFLQAANEVADEYVQTRQGDDEDEHDNGMHADIGDASATDTERPASL